MFMNRALTSLHQSMSLFLEYEQKYNLESSPFNESLYLATRDSMIQRFEYCTDLFWKLLKAHLETVEMITLTINSPKGIIREAVLAHIISEKQGTECQTMITARNQTSYIYHEEVAEEIANAIINSYYALMSTIIQKIEKRA